MNIKPTYVPIMKWKQGEQGALKELSTSVKDAIIPLIEITPDFNEDKLLSTMKSWENRTFYFDVVPDCYDTDTEIYFRILKQLNPEFVIPVLCLDDSLEIIESAAELSNLGFALRITTNDIDNIDEAISVIIGKFKAENIDLILDMKFITAENVREKFTVLKSMLSDIPNIDSFRNIILASSSFPETLSDIEKYHCANIDRLDWSFWLKSVDKLNEKYDIKLIYSDYCIANPKYVSFIPGMSPSFNIRYTSDEYFVVLKGNTIKKGGLDSENISELSKEIIDLEAFSGENYSWGDNYIYTRATADVDSYGNLGTWRKVGTNHHITFVIDQLSNLL